VSGKKPVVQQKSMRISCVAPGAKEVFLAGTFNGWQPGATPMRKRPDGKWLAELNRPPGRYEFQFIVDGQWCCEPGFPDQACFGERLVLNSSGTSNRVLEVQ